MNFDPASPVSSDRPLEESASPAKRSPLLMGASFLIVAIAAFISVYAWQNFGDQNDGQLDTAPLALSQVTMQTQVTMQNKTEKGNTEENKKATKAEKEKNPYPGLAPAPGFKGGKEWLNVAAPIDMRDLKGKIVLLDFWTYCCINCMHILPDLKFLEEKYPNQIVVIGVHSAKFDNEQGTDNIRNAILRYEIAHPVVNDAEMKIWRNHAVRSWPTLMIIDPEGKYVGRVSGEGKRELLDSVISKMVTYHRKNKTLDEKPVRFRLEKLSQRPTPLRYPGKVLVDAKSQKLFISDSNNNRIVVTSLEGKLLEIIGSGKMGAVDGNYLKSSFDHPQGMALKNGILYVADTENHLIRTVDLQKKSVATLAGTGKQARRHGKGGPLLTTALNSPWDISIVDEKLYIAMAGPHQLWRHKIGGKQIELYAGTGRENIVDGSLAESALAQPSGIVNDGNDLFFVDSEGSAVRKIVRATKSAEGSVVTIAGPTHSLFKFGDVDAVGKKARFQHPLGIAFSEGTLYIADSYNHKIRTVDLKTGAVKSWLGTGKAGAGTLGKSPKSVMLSEPSGLAVANGKLYIADTNNHRLLVADLKTKAVKELVVQGLKPPKSTQSEKTATLPIESDSDVRAEVVKLQAIKPGKTMTAAISFDLPKEFKLNTLAPVLYRVTVVETAAGAAVKKEAVKKEQSVLEGAFLGKRHSVKIKEGRVQLSLPLQAAAKGKVTLQIAADYQYCREGKSGICKLGTTVWKVPVEIDAKGASEFAITAKPE